ncbi:MAG: hypothetical protein RJA07_2200 [Bacteroidota bacterium]|jgi:hypothetical protein
MKKISYIVLGGMLVFAACQPNNTQDAAKIQHTIDSTAAELAKPEIEKMQKACDDEIMTAAMDSAKVIMEHAKKGIVHHAKAVVKKVEPKASDIKTGGLHSKADGSKDAGSIGSTGLHGKSDQSNVKTDNGNIGKGGLHSKADKK